MKNYVRESETISGNPFRVAVSYIEICDCANLTIWLGIFLIYKAVLLFYGLHMAWKVRTVYTRKLIDAQYCATLLLIALPFCFFGIIFAFSLRLYPTPHYALLGIIIIIYSFVVLVTLFGHKIINILHRPVILVHSKSNTTKSRRCGCLTGLCSCLSPLNSCWSAFTAVFCCCCCCCKGLREALLRGPKQNRDSFLKTNTDDRMDYQIGDMPGDREKQIIILKKELEKKEKYLSQLKGLQQSTQAVKQTQTTDFFYNQNVQEVSTGSSAGQCNESYEDDNGDKHRTGKHRHNRFKIFHRKLDFSHVSSRVDSGLDGKSSVKRNGTGEILENKPYQSSPQAEVELLQRNLYEREKELNQLKAYLGIHSSSVEQSSKVESLASIGEESSNTYSRADGNTSLVLNVYPDKTRGDKTSDVTNSSQSHNYSRPDVDSENEYSRKGSDLEQNVAAVSSSEVSLQPLISTVTLDDEFDHNDTTIMQQSCVKKEEGLGNHLNSSNQNADRKINNFRIFNSPYITSHMQTRGRFQKKIRQLSTLGVFKTSNSSTTTIKVTPFNQVEGKQNNGSGDGSLRISNATESKKKARSIDENFANTASQLNDQQPGVKLEQYPAKPTNNVLIINTPSNYSHVKSRLFTPTPNMGDEGSPSTKRQTKVDDEKITNENNDQGGKENNQYSKNRSNVKIFNAPTDYSHVKSRLFEGGNKTDSDQQQSQTFKQKVNQMRSFGVLKHSGSTE